MTEILFFIFIIPVATELMIDLDIRYSETLYYTVYMFVYHGVTRAHYQIVVEPVHTGLLLYTPVTTEFHHFYCDQYLPAVPTGSFKLFCFKVVDTGLLGSKNF